LVSSFSSYVGHRDLHSFPTRRSSDLEEGLELEPGEAAEELLARMLEYARYRATAAMLRELLDAEHGYRYRSAPLPPQLRRVSVRSEEHTSELQSRFDLVCRLLLEKKK